MTETITLVNGDQRITALIVPNICYCHDTGGWRDQVCHPSSLCPPSHVPGIVRPKLLP